MTWLDLESLQLGPAVYTVDEGEHVVGKGLMRAWVLTGRLWPDLNELSGSTYGHMIALRQGEDPRVRIRSIDQLQ